MRHFILSGMIFVAASLPASLASDASGNEPIRNEKDLAKAMGQLRKKYEPFLQSIPEKVDVRARRDLCSQTWRARYEMGEGPYAAGSPGTEPPPMKKWYGADLDDSEWDRVTMPEWRFKTSKPGGKKGKTVPYGCVLWYRTSFKSDSPSGNKRVFLVFEGADWTAEVWLNGKKLGSHTGYCEPFRFDVTSLLQKENKLAVRVSEGSWFGEPSAGWAVFPMPTCPPPMGRIVRDRSKSLTGFQRGDPHMGTGYGIHREVYLETVGEACVAELYARGRPQDGNSAIKVRVDAAAAMPIVVEIDVMPENFKGKAYKHVEKLEAKKGLTDLAVNIPMPDAKRWSPEEPWLYRCRVTLKDGGGKIVDARDAIFGYRSFGIVSEVNPREGHSAGRMLLNGKPVMLYGANITGLNALWYWGETEKIVDILLMLKAAGYNAVRSCQHVQFPEVRELEDRLGIMSQQDVGGAYPKHGTQVMAGLEAAAVALARVTHNNPGVVLHCYSNETAFEPDKLVALTLAQDPDRVIVPISGHPWQVIGDPAKGRTGYKSLTLEQWANVIDDVHSYQGWYGAPGQPWRWTLVYPEDDRMITIGEYGGEAIDGYETMLKYPEHWGKAPAKDAKTLYGNVQTKPREIKQAIGFRQNRMPQTLEEHIQASQTVQADILMEVTKGWRLSKRVGGYFQFHFVDVNAATWPKSIVSHDLRPKKGYFAMAQMNRPTIALPRLIQNAEVMELWVDNDTSIPYRKAVLEWSVEHDGKVAIQGRETVDVPAWNPQKVKQVDLSSLSKAGVATVSLKLVDSGGAGLCEYEQEFHLRAYRDLFWPEGESFRRNERRRRSTAWAEARKKHGANATIEDAKRAYRELYRQQPHGDADKEGKKQAESVVK